MGSKNQKWIATRRRKERAKASLKILGDHFGQAGTALNHENPFQLLIATLLSAQCTDVRVNLVTEEFFSEYPDVEAMDQLSEKEIAHWIRSINFFPTKARNIRRLIDILREEYGDVIPRNREGLESLPGVGRKTANVVMANAFGIPSLAVDTHVHRVGNRLGLARSRNANETELQLTRLIPKEKWILAHHWFIYHGREICHARKPQCSNCLLASLCPSKNKV